jgi:hypothetical protein
MQKKQRTLAACLLLCFLLVGCSANQPIEPTNTPSPEMLSTPEATPGHSGSCPPPKVWAIEFQREGGFMGLSQQLKVASDGTTQAQDLQTGEVVTGTLEPSQSLEIENLLVQACPFETGRAAQTCADCYEYSMSIQMDQEQFRLKVSDTSIPQDMQPLIQMLSSLLQQMLVP